MFYPDNFLSSMKLKLLNKIGDINFNHKWKEIVLKQVNYPDHPGICFENGLVSDVFSFTFDLVQCYLNWKNTTAKSTNACINHCIWGNSLITDIGRKLWLPKLIDYDINYLSDFVNSDGEVMSYQEFCKESLNHCWHIINKREYVDIKMAIRRFHNYDFPQKNVANILPSLCLKFYTDSGTEGLKAKNIRDISVKKMEFNEILPLNNWARELGNISIEWKLVFRNLYGGFTKNHKIVQFQYKLLMRISTCRYMRHKMKIDMITPNCTFCLTNVETLEHIYLYCPKTVPLIIYLEYLVTNNLENNYVDQNRITYITCNHENPFINYIWASFKLFISRCFQTSKEPSLKSFENFVIWMLVGEQDETCCSVRNVLNLH